jgi:hypothetical protein
MPQGIGGAYLQPNDIVEIAKPASLEKRILPLFVSLIFLLSIAAFAAPSLQNNDAVHLREAKMALNAKAGYVSAVSFTNFLPVENIQSLGKLDSKSVESISLQILSDNKQSLKINPKNLKLQNIMEDKSATSDGGFFFVFFNQYYKDIPVRDAEVKFLYVDNKIASMNAKYYPSIKLETKPKINEKKAAEIAKRAVKFDEKQDSVFNKELYILPLSEDGANSKLVWFVDLTSQGETLQLAIDAMNGEVIRKRSTAEHATIEGRVTSVIYDDYNPPYADFPPSNSRVVPVKDLTVAVYNTSYNQSFASSVTNSDGFYSIGYTNTTPGLLFSKFDPRIYPNGYGIYLRSPYSAVRFTLPEYPDAEWANKAANHTYSIQSPTEPHDWLFKMIPAR